MRPVTSGMPRAYIPLSLNHSQVMLSTVYAAIVSVLQAPPVEFFTGVHFFRVFFIIKSGNVRQLLSDA